MSISWSFQGSPILSNQVHIPRVRISRFWWTDVKYSLSEKLNNKGVLARQLRRIVA